MLQHRLRAHFKNSKCKFARAKLLIESACYVDFPVARIHSGVAMRALPRWLRTLGHELRPLDWHVKSGWVALHSAALRGGNAASFRGRHSTELQSLQIRLDQYRSLVLDIPRRTGFGDENLGKNWMRAAMQIGQALADRVGEQGLMGVADTNLSIGEFVADTRAELSRVAPSIGVSIATPFDALQTAYQVLRHGRSTKSVRASELYCLAWINVAAQGILRMHHCELCFRWAIPGHDYCYEHSQSKEAPGSPQEKSLRYRNAAKIAVTFRHPPRPLPKHSTMSVRRLPKIMARLIWSTPLPDEERTVRSIKNALARHPTVLAVVGHDASSLGSIALYKRLGECIDPLEINPSAWVWKIKQLDRWGHEKSTRCPGRRGTGCATRSRIVNAISLAKHGYSKSLIAEILDIHPSTISNWIRRSCYPDLANALKPKKKLK